MSTLIILFLFQNISKTHLRPVTLPVLLFLNSDWIWLKFVFAAKMGWISWSLHLYHIHNSFILLVFISAFHHTTFSDSYSELVPVDGPPSFRGQAVKYVYKLTIGCQRVNSPIKLLRVPFRVLVLQGERALDRFRLRLLLFCPTLCSWICEEIQWRIKMDEVRLFLI